MRAAVRILSLLDLTSLGEADTEADVRALCRAADTPVGTPAAVCVWTRFVASARDELTRIGIGRGPTSGAVAGTEGPGTTASGRSGVAVATVANFPAGDDDVDAAAAEVRAAVFRGADEVDVVFPWRTFLAGDPDVGSRLVAACRTACDSAAREGRGPPERAILKVILETGELGTPEAVAAAGQVAVRGGADFLKTSTGKVPVGATPEAVDALLGVVRQADGRVGLKISGGVRTVAQAVDYLGRIRAVMGDGWIRPDRVRFGASSLLSDIRAVTADGRSGERGSRAGGAP